MLPGSNNQPLRFLPIARTDPNEAAGQYALEVKAGGSRESLAVYEGKAVELISTPRAHA